MSAAWLAALFQLVAFSPSQGVDYVVHLEVVEGHGASSGDRSTIYRSGDLMRTDSTLYRDSTGTTYVDLARGLTVTASWNHDGVLTGMTIRREATRQARRLPPTGRHDSLLGETCTIWRFLEEDGGSGSEACGTADGIPLWRAFWYPHSDDRTVMYERATAVERRPVRREELLPPRNLLALVVEAPPTTTRVGPGAPDYEVEMVGSNRVDGSYVLRSHGGFMSNASQDPEGRFFFFRNPAASLSYSEDGRGRPRSLEVMRNSANPFNNVEGGWEEVPGRAPEHLLGETCTWQEFAAIQSDEQNYECRTADGIVLKTETGGHYGAVRHFTARRLSRRPLRDTDFAPPARALDWATWGITPTP